MVLSICPLFSNKGEGPNNIWIHLTLQKQQSIIIIFTFYSGKGGDQHLWDMSLFEMNNIINGPISVYGGQFHAEQSNINISSTNIMNHNSSMIKRIIQLSSCNFDHKLIFVGFIHRQKRKVHTLSGVVVRVTFRSVPF